MPILQLVIKVFILQRLHQQPAFIRVMQLLLLLQQQFEYVLHFHQLLGFLLLLFQLLLSFLLLALLI